MVRQAETLKDRYGSDPVIAAHPTSGHTSPGYECRISGAEPMTVSGAWLTEYRREYRGEPATVALRRGCA